MSWFYLILAGLFEIGWPIGLKIAQSDSNRIKGIIIATLCMVMSSYFLYLAQKTIPLGTAYAVWSGIGAAGTFIAGILLFGDHAAFMHYFGIILIIFGVAALRLAS